MIFFCFTNGTSHQNSIISNTNTQVCGCGSKVNRHINSLTFALLKIKWPLMCKSALLSNALSFQWKFAFCKHQLHWLMTNQLWLYIHQHRRAVPTTTMSYHITGFVCDLLSCDVGAAVIKNVANRDNYNPVMSICFWVTGLAHSLQAFIASMVLMVNCL